MPKKKRRKGSRSGSRRHHAPGHGVPPVRGGEPSGLLDDVHRLLGHDDPAGLLEFASTLLAVADPRARDPLARLHDEDEPAISLSQLVDTFVDVPIRETTALLTVFAEMVGDELIARRIRRELAGRGDQLPSWLELSPVTVNRAVVMAHVLGDGDNVLLAARTGAGHHMTVVIYIDHNLGTVAKDAFVLHEPLDAAVASFRSVADEDPDVTFVELGLADARARVTEAIDHGAMVVPPLETDSWPAARPLVEWIVRHLPEGGEGYEHQRPEWAEADRKALTEDFFASPYGRGHDADDRQLFDSLLWFGCDYGPGDPLRWSPVAVEMLLSDWLPRKIVADADFLSRAPDLLRSFIRYSHARRGIRDELTRQTLDAVDRWEPEYQQTIRAPRLQGPAALLAAMGVVEDLPSYDERMLDIVRKAVGDEGVDDLDDAPLPGEPLDLADVPPDIHDAVRTVSGIVDTCCEQLLDVEHRTAARRLLADVAAADPAIFRRRARAETAAAAIVWIVVKANLGFGSHNSGFTASALGQRLGVGTAPGQRAPTFLKAIDTAEQGYGDIWLGSPRYLVSDRRRSLIELRDRYSGA